MPGFTRAYGAQHRISSLPGRLMKRTTPRVLILMSGAVILTVVGSPFDVRGVARTVGSIEAQAVVPIRRSTTWW